MRYWVFVSLRASLYQGDSSQRAWLTVQGAMEVHLRWWFYWWHQVTHRPLWGCDVGCYPGWWERETLSKSKGQRGWGGFGRILAHRQALHVALSPRTTCRHLHLEGSIPRHKQLRVPLENRIYWFLQLVLIEGNEISDILCSSQLFFIPKTNFL